MKNKKKTGKWNMHTTIHKHYKHTGQITGRACVKCGFSTAFHQRRMQTSETYVFRRCFVMSSTIGAMGPLEPRCLTFIRMQTLTHEDGIKTSIFKQTKKKHHWPCNNIEQKFAIKLIPSLSSDDRMQMERAPLNAKLTFYPPRRSSHSRSPATWWE